MPEKFILADVEVANDKLRVKMGEKLKFNVEEKKEEHKGEEVDLLIDRFRKELACVFAKLFGWLVDDIAWFVLRANNFRKLIYEPCIH